MAGTASRPPRVAGAVLLGGASRRMGTDKALVEIDGRPMAARVAAALEAGGCGPVVVVGGDAEAYASLGLRHVPDRWPGEGPLGAIVTVLGALEADLDTGIDAVVVAACDLPWLDRSSIEALVEQYAGAEGSVDAVVARSDRLEPLCALWARRARGPLEQMMVAGERAVHRALGALQVLTVPIESVAVTNVNSPADLPDAHLQRQPPTG